MENLGAKQLSENQERKKPRLDPNSETVLIGFKGSEAMRSELKDCADTLGLSYSEFLRATAQDSITRVKRLREGFEK